ncbi:hypothetical protein FRC02_007495 [Tulasnella sp. 418]|nr:hypothetical protein FRC02_007495 [Tulasnella sp. 418]
MSFSPPKPFFSPHSYKVSASEADISSALPRTPLRLMKSVDQVSRQLLGQLNDDNNSQAPTIPDSQVDHSQDSSSASSRSRGPSPEPRGLDPSDNLRAYCAGAILPPIPSDLQNAIEEHMATLLQQTSPQANSTVMTVTNVRARRTKLAAKPKEGYRVLAEIERIEQSDIYSAVLAYHLENTRHSPITSSYLEERFPGIVPENKGDEMKARRAAMASFPFKLASQGFVVDTSIDLDETDCPTPKASTTPLPPIPSFGDDAPPGLYRTGSGLGGFMELEESLDMSIRETSSSLTFENTSLPTSQPTSASSSSSASSIAYISQLSHLLRQTLLPTASSILSLHEPELQEYEWFGPESGIQGLDKIFGGRNGLMGWDGRIWGRRNNSDGWSRGPNWTPESSTTAEMNFLLAVQPPWCMPRQNFVDFSQAQEFTDGIRGETSFDLYEKLWATLFDACSQLKIRYFAITSYEYIAFGCFDQSFKVGYITPPIENKPRAPGAGDRREPSILETLVYWMRSSLGNHEYQWTVPDRQSALLGVPSEIVGERRIRETQLAQRVDWEVTARPGRGVKRVFMEDEKAVQVILEWDPDCHRNDDEVESLSRSHKRARRSGDIGGDDYPEFSRMSHLPEAEGEDEDDGYDTERGKRRAPFDVEVEEEDMEDDESEDLRCGSGSGSGTWVHPSGYPLRATPARDSSTATYRRVSSTTRRTSTSQTDSRAARPIAPMPKRHRAKSVAFAVKTEDEEDYLDKELAGQEWIRRAGVDGRDVFDDDLGTPQPIAAAAEVDDVVMGNMDTERIPVAYRTRGRSTSQHPQNYPTPPPSRLRHGRLSASARREMSSPIKTVGPPMKKRRMLLVRPERSLPSRPPATSYNLRQRRK